MTDEERAVALLKSMGEWFGETDEPIDPDDIPKICAALATAHEAGAQAERERLTALVPEGLLYCPLCRRQRRWPSAGRCDRCLGPLVRIIAPQEPEKGGQGGEP